MRTLRLGKTGVEVSAISYGTWPFSGPNTNRAGVPVGWSGHDDQLGLAALRAAHAAGINHWDTADVYGDGRSEALIGRVWGDVPRDEVFLASKVGWDPGEFGHYYHPQLIRQRIERSLKNLQVERLDLYYLHHCDFGDNDAYLDDAVGLLRQLRDEGKIRFIGLSDWDASKIVRVADRVDPDVIQPYRNVSADDYVSSGLKEWVDAHDVGVAFFSPIRHGLLLGKYQSPPEFGEGDFRLNVPAFRDADKLALLREKRAALEERFAGRDQPVLGPLLGALLSDAPAGCVLLGLRNPDQVAAAAAVEALSYDEATWVRELYQDVNC